MNEAYRCAGLLVLREMGKPFSMKAEALLSSGYKVRVIGVPDCLTFVEGSWILSSMPRNGRSPGHWGSEEMNSAPPAFKTQRSDGYYQSLDLSKATDGLHHDVVEVTIEGLVSRGDIRESDITMAKRSLGLEKNATWSFNGDKAAFLRGSPMGTPLSFVVLSWTNGWSTSVFDKKLTHGDDAVGWSKSKVSTDNPSIGNVGSQLRLYSNRVKSMGQSLNKTKTFSSRSSFTACEKLVLPANDANDNRMVVADIPSIASVELKAPPACRALESVMQRREERIAVTRFPWLTRMAETHLPVSIGGFGYVGRGLAVGRSLRIRLAALVSRAPTLEQAKGLNSKKPFREMGLYPRALERVVKPADHWKAVKVVASYDLFKRPEPELYDTVTLFQALAFETILVEEEISLASAGAVKRKPSGRPGRNKRSNGTFKRLSIKRQPAPLSKEGGVGSIDRWAKRCKLLPVPVDLTVASEIRERIPDQVTPRGNLGSVI
jgi:hypothetical protein